MIFAPGIGSPVLGMGGWGKPRAGMPAAQVADRTIAVNAVMAMLFRQNIQKYYS
jgi:hypothetical protein